MSDLAGIADTLSALTVMEAAELAHMLEEKWGVSAAAPVAQTGPAHSAEPVVEAQTEFDAVLVSFGEKKLEVVKALRPVTGLGLKESMTFVTDLPKTLKSGITKDEAEKIKRDIEGAGGTVEIR